MKRSWKLLAVAILWVGTAPAGADLVVFDDLGGDQVPIPAGYKGFTWSSSFYYINATPYPLSGYYAGMVSSPNVAYNGWWDDVAVSAASPFTFNGAYFTGAWNDGLEIDISGWLGASKVHNTTVTVSSTTPTWVGLDWTNIDRLKFHSYGGTHNPDYSGTGLHFVMDNFTYNEPISAVPVPGAAVLGVLGLSFAGWRLRRKTV
jgi:hypothetical protein